MGVWQYTKFKDIPGCQVSNSDEIAYDTLKRFATKIIGDKKCKETTPQSLKQIAEEGKIIIFEYFSTIYTINTDYLHYFSSLHS